MQYRNNQKCYPIGNSVGENAKSLLKVVCPKLIIKRKQAIVDEPQVPVYPAEKRANSKNIIEIIKYVKR